MFGAVVGNFLGGIRLEIISKHLKEYISSQETYAEGNDTIQHDCWLEEPMSAETTLLYILTHFNALTFYVSRRRWQTRDEEKIVHETVLSQPRPLTPHRRRRPKLILALSRDTSAGLRLKPALVGIPLP